MVCSCNSATPAVCGEFAGAGSHGLACHVARKLKEGKQYPNSYGRTRNKWSTMSVL